MRPMEGSQTVKSARRVLEVLELFASRRQALTVSQIATGLNYPQSSTSVLMRSLLELGYVDYLPHRRAYCPTLRVSLLAAWCDDPLYDRRAFAALLDQVRLATGGTVLLARQHQVDAEVLMTAPGTVVPAALAVGSAHPLSASALGLAILAGYDDSAVGRMLRRIQATLPAAASAAAAPAVTAARQAGYAGCADGIAPGAAMVAIRLPGHGVEPPLALGVLDHREVIEGDGERYVAALRQAVRRLPMQPRPAVVQRSVA